MRTFSLTLFAAIFIFRPSAVSIRLLLIDHHGLNMSSLLSSSSSVGVPFSCDVNCIFCQLASARSSEPPTNEESSTGLTLPPDRILYRDRLCYVVRDIHPAAELHLLVIPLAHIRDSSVLDSSHRDLLHHMRMVGEKMLHEHAPSQVIARGSRLGFHLAPFISVPHLHLHVQAGHYRCCCVPPSWCCFPCDCNRIKYTDTCGNGWWKTIDKVEEQIGAVSTREEEQPPKQQMMEV